MSMSTSQSDSLKGLHDYASEEIDFTSTSLTSSTSATKHGQSAPVSLREQPATDHAAAQRDKSKGKLPQTGATTNQGGLLGGLGLLLAGLLGRKKKRQTPKDEG